MKLLSSNEEKNLNLSWGTFCVLLMLPNGELRGELLRVYVLGLLLPEEIPSLLDSVRNFRGLLREISVFRPANQTSASSLSLHIWCQLVYDTRLQNWIN